MKFNRLKNLLFVFSFVVFCQISLPAQMSQAKTDLANYIKENYTKREVLIPMRDGVKLFTSIYEPKNKTEKYPIMFSRTPYTVAPYGKDNDGNEQFKNSLGPNELFAREGYIFVYQDVRGRWESEGEFEDVRPETATPGTKETDESTDAYDTVDWLIKNVENNNGRVGIWGISYPGFYTSTAVINSHPAIKAASPQAPVSDWFHGDDMHHNGALFLAQNYDFFGFFGQPRPKPETPETTVAKQFKLTTQDGYRYFGDLGGLKETADNYQKEVGTRIKFWDEMMSHPNYDQYWKDRNVLPKLKNIHAAIMTVGGWYDDEDLYGALHTYQSIEKQNPGIYNVLVIGPWFHGGWERSEGDFLGTAYFGQKTSVNYRSQVELPFFNHFLKDKGDISNIKEVNLFDTGANEWKSFATWDPKEGVTQTPVYLQAGGKLSFEKPADVSNNPMTAYDEYVSDPMKPVPYTQKITSNYPKDFMTEDQRFAATRPDVMVYQSDVLTQDMTVAGYIHPNLFVSSSSTDSDFVVKLIDVFPDDYKYPEGIKPPETSAFSVFEPGGYEMLLRGEPFPARFRNSFEKPEPLTPNQPVNIKYEMPGITHTFKKGHRIMVQIQSTWFPLVARNPQKFMDNYKLATTADFQKATERVYRGGAYSSMIELPVLKK